MIFRYEKEKSHMNAKHSAEVERLEEILKDKSERISILEQRLDTEVQEKRHLVKSVMGVVKNVNVDSQSNSVRIFSINYINPYTNFV